MQISESDIFSFINQKNIPYLKKYSDYLNIIIKYNSELNLFSRTINKEQLIIDHFYDCVDGFNYFESYNTIADLGSGGGFPGILLAITFPYKKVLLIEKSAKKCEYLLKVIKELSLVNVSIINKVLENNHLSEVDVVTCRAFKPIDIILELTENYYKEYKKYILYKGKLETISTELQRAEKKLKISIENKYKTEKICLLNKEKERHLVFIN